MPDPSTTVSCRDWAAEVVFRYRNDPTILAWQLVNEPEVLPGKDASCDLVPEATAESVLAATCTSTAPRILGILSAAGGYPTACVGYANPRYVYTYVPGTLSVVCRTTGFASPSTGSTWKLGTTVPVRFAFDDRDRSANLRRHDDGARREPCRVSSQRPGRQRWGRPA